MENSAGRSRNYNGGQLSKTAKKSRRKTKKTGNKFKRILFVFIMFLTAVTVFLFLTNKYFFKVQKIVIKDADNNEKYSYDEILNASGIIAGGELYGMDLKQIKYNIENRLTYVTGVNIIRLPPSTVSIEVKTDKGMFGIKLGGDYYIVSDKFRVVEKIDIVGSGTSGTEDFTPPDGVITVVTDAVKKCCVGENIEFKDKDISDFLESLVNLFNERDLSGVMDSAGISISSVNLDDKFNVVMNYGDRFLVEFGLFDNISPKILNSFEVVKRVPDGVKGIIDMTSEKAASFEYDENILKNKLYFGIG